MKPLNGQKLTAAQVRKIRSLHRKNWRQIELAKEFNVSQTAISLLLSGKTYAQIKDAA